MSPEPRAAGVRAPVFPAGADWPNVARPLRLADLRGTRASRVAEAGAAVRSGALHAIRVTEPGVQRPRTLALAGLEPARDT